MSKFAVIQKAKIAGKVRSSTCFKEVKTVRFTLAIQNSWLFESYFYLPGKLIGEVTALDVVAFSTFSNLKAVFILFFKTCFVIMITVVNTVESA